MPTEKTPNGANVPIPKRGEFFDNLSRAAKITRSTPTTPPEQKRGKGNRSRPQGHGR